MKQLLKKIFKSKKPPALTITGDAEDTLIIDSYVEGVDDKGLRTKIINSKLRK